MVSVITALQGVRPDDSEKWPSHMEEGDGSYTKVTVSAMLEGKNVALDVIGYVAHNGGNNGWPGPMSSGDWVRLRTSWQPQRISPDLNNEFLLRQFAKQTGGFWQVMDGDDWEWNDVSCAFEGVDSYKEALLTIIGTDNSAAADKILEDRDVAAALKDFLEEFLA
jgi:hypothetical protein